MKSFTRKLATAGSALAFAASSLLLASSPASAATSCYGSSCTGLDPSTTICQNDARTVSWSDRFGVELRYSPTCRAAWARATSSSSDAPMEVHVHNTVGDNYGTYTTGQTVWTQMVNDKDIQAQAYGYKQETGGWGQTGWY
ncbi:DUF2690 domain-containing protein [Streptomyces sp. NPDC057027]|uniref:DUF2690 domain-containing protein n=1 Tax=unclassified Streptomyces TaxID=2593676 RepID=UPI0036457EC4